MTISLETAAEIYRQAMKLTVKRYALLLLSEGALLIVAGILAILYPLLSSTGIAVPLGWLLIITAVLQGIVLFAMRSMPHAGFQALSVLIALLVGFLLLREPQQAQQTIILLVIIFLMVQGAARLLFGLTIRPYPNWTWVAASGALGVLLSLVLLANLPEPAVWLVALMVGIELMAEGAAIGFLAWQTSGIANKATT